MTIKIRQLTNTVLQRLFDAKSNLILLGAPGIGKTQRVHQFAAQQGLPMLDFRATMTDATDIGGFAVPSKREDGTSVTLFTLSPILTAIRDTKSERGILFLDEFFQGDHLVQKAFGQVFSEREIRGHKFPDGWAIWGASNRVQDRAGRNNVLSHIRNRVTMLDVESDQEGWLAWADKAGIHPMATGFARFRPGLVFNNEVPAGDEPYCSPRSLVNAFKYLTEGAVDMRLPNDDVSREIVHGFVGPTATELFAFLSTHQFLPESKEEIIADPEGCKLPPADRMDAQFAAVAMAVDAVTPKVIDPFIRYVFRLSKEFQTSAMVSIFKKLDVHSGSLLNSPLFARWAADNRALITSSISEAKS